MPRARARSASDVAVGETIGIMVDDEASIAAFKESGSWVPGGMSLMTLQ